MTSIRRVTRGVRVALKDTAARALLAFLFGLILWDSAFYHFVEGWKWVDAIYFSVVTLSTVGYGDFSPETTAGKIFTVVFIIVGFGLFVSAVTTLASVILSQSDDDIKN